MADEATCGNISFIKAGLDTRDRLPFLSFRRVLTCVFRDGDLRFLLMLGEIARWLRERGGS